MSQRTETYRVELLNFPGASLDDAGAALAQAFGIAEELARSYVSEAPCAVRTGIDGATARAYTQSLLGIGASVRVVAEASGRAREFTATDLLALTEADVARDDAASRESPPDEAPIGSKPVVLEEKVGPRTATCPACGHRQSPTPSCEHCGYEFPKTIERTTPPGTGGRPKDEQGAATPADDVDVFETLRTSGERRAVEARSKRARSKRIRLVWTESELTKRRRRRILIYSLVGVLVAATLIFVLLTPGPQRSGDPVPPGAIPPPPGFHYRRL